MLKIIRNHEENAIRFFFRHSTIEIEFIAGSPPSVFYVKRFYSYLINIP